MAEKFSSQAKIMVYFSSDKNKYDQIMTEIGSSLFDIRMKLTQFVLQLMDEFDTVPIKLDLSFPFFDGDKFVILDAEEIFFNEETEFILIRLSGNDEFLNWAEIDVATQEHIANSMLAEYTAQNIYRNLNASDQNGITKQ